MNQEDLEALHDAFGKQRDPARIGRILGLLTELWARNPDWRLRQLVVNAHRASAQRATLRHYDSRLFDTEDDVLERGLLKLLESVDHVRVDGRPCDSGGDWIAPHFCPRCGQVWTPVEGHECPNTP